MVASPTHSSTAHNGLITYILRQLKECNVKMFQDHVHELHVKFQEAKLPSLTVHALLIQLKDKIQVLKHADEWKENDSLRYGSHCWYQIDSLDRGNCL